MKAALADIDVLSGQARAELLEGEIRLIGKQAEEPLLVGR